MSKYLILLAIFFILPNDSVFSAENNIFVGNLQLEKLPVSEGDHSFKLLKSFTYIDKKGVAWSAPKGIKVNGASIPPILWSFVGSPWSGKYPEASVIHDHFCQTKSRPWKEVHRTFYDAMIANGVGKLNAKIKYYAVYRFGPRWTNTEKNFRACLLHYGFERDRSFRQNARHSDVILIDGAYGACGAASQHSGRVVLIPRINEVELSKSIAMIKKEDPSVEEIEAIASFGIKDSQPNLKYLRAQLEKNPQLLEVLREIEVAE